MSLRLVVARRVRQSYFFGAGKAVEELLRLLSPLSDWVRVEANLFLDHYAPTALIPVAVLLFLLLQQSYRSSVRARTVHSLEVSHRRRAERVACCLESSYQPTDDLHDNPWPATIRDISEDGLGMIVHRPCSPGATLTLTLGSPARTRTGPLRVQVAHAREHLGGWFVGGAFADRLSRAQLQALLN